MDKEHLIKRLADIARKESIPEIDVAAAVIDRLKTAELIPDQSIFWFLAGSGAAAAAAAVYAFTVHFADPMAALAGLQDPVSSIVSFVFSFASSITGVQL